MTRLLTTSMMLLGFFLLSGCSKPEKPITTLNDAKDARIGVMVGSTGEQIDKERFPQAQVKSFDDIMMRCQP